MTGAIWLTFAAAAGISFLPDRIAVPRVQFRRRIDALLLHALVVVFFASLMLLVTARPIFSSSVAVALVGLVAVVSNAKYESLREPFVFTDLSLFSQLFSHPRLYLPFLSTGKIVAIGVGIVLVVAGYLAEAPVTPRPVLALVAVVTFTFSLARYIAARLPLALDAADDQRRHGFFAVFIAYLLNGMRPATFEAFRRAVEAGPFATGTPVSRPDVIVIQSESLFDVRRISPAINPTVLSRFDRARSEAVCYGELSVPAWGANTMRTEFAMLTGLAYEQLGYARFYPYAFVRRACASIARWFAQAGYNTVAIHPYYADFFGRNRVFPLLGFDKFLDIEHFADAARAGPYISDAAVLDAVLAELEAARDKPQFVFAMTMENHGPLHLEQVLPGESSSRHTLGEGTSWRDLTAYLRHIENADVMIGRLLDHLRASDRETVVCFYGDHVPALPHVFEKLGVTPQTSDYFIWRNYGTDAPECRNLAAEELGAALLHVVQDDGNRAEEPCASEKAT
ncbi:MULTISPECIES: LTA synthase family protein [Burkholderia]|uniref:LTA synthase family protein n=3 Tax=Bacteria TaxID=2 RepID=A0A1E3FKX9_9BURK|nr:MULTISPECIES: LTA synthase family protein [Burkholderia]UTP21508.1 LTA synthase family protein [Burkholderia sp. FXe9]KKL39770.1 capsular biosynthesis protein [Burkholderia contaminans LMG 23361]MBA9828312.1 LTA synthase family protein [Burkholderia contaminans]MBA9836861.1 LTA synthase family protein [Burkholderia contaminans]MBA9863245.1 LTA synthase family protein [Burkholderia contaminans]